MTDTAINSDQPAGPRDGVVTLPGEPRMRGALYEAEGLLTRAAKLIRLSTSIAGEIELLETADRLFEIEWHDRGQTPPKGRLWASDGYSLWTILSDGFPIPDGATRVKYWATMLIPKPPLLQPGTSESA